MTEVDRHVIRGALRGLAIITPLMGVIALVTQSWDPLIGLAVGAPLAAVVVGDGILAGCIVRRFTGGDE